MRTAALIFIFIVVFAVGVPVLAGTMMWVRITDPYKGYAAEQFVDVPRGATTADIGTRLINGGVVRDRWTFRAALWWTGRSRTLKAGEYRFDRPMTAVDVVEKIARGDVYTRRITFPEGLTVRDMAAIYENAGFGSAGSFSAAANDVSFVKDLDPQAGDLEGYLFPDTYALPRDMPPTPLIRVMVDRFRSEYTEDLRRDAEISELTTRQVVTLASLIEKETARDEERPLVAAVYRNRLRLGIPLQADPTVVYALQKAGRYTGNIRREDLSIASPYNTYQRPGLPPGPIAAPGRASLQAAVRPAPVRHLYFVSRNDGSHVFADTLAQHNANVRRFQVEFFRNQRPSGGSRRR